MNAVNLQIFGKNILDFYKETDEQKESKLPRNIKHCFLSVFNKWLDNEECEKLCHTFSMLKSHINNPAYEDEWRLYYSYEEKFKIFYSALFKYGVYKVKNCSFEDEIFLEEPIDFEHYESYFMPNIRESSPNFSLFLVKGLNLAINGGFDHTHELFVSNEYDHREFEKIVSEAGLFVLN